LKTKFRIIIIVAIVLIAAIVLPRLKSPEKIKKPERAVEQRLLMMAFFENGWGGVYGDSLPVFQENYRSVDTISPCWYSVDDDGQIRVDRSRTEVLDFSRSKGVPVIPLVTNWQGKSSRFLTDETARRNSLTHLADLARNYRGLNLDIEYLPSNFKAPLVQYVQELRRLFAREKKRLFVCVYPQVDFPESRSGLHDYYGLSGACDGLIMMAYDYHRPGTPAGPVAPISWVEANIQYALKTVAPGKLWLGIPGYGYRWRGGAKAEAIPAWKAAEDAREQKIPVQWDRASRTPYFILGENSADGVVWYEDRRSTEAKIKLAKKYRLKGVALWRLGYEAKDFWGLFQARSQNSTKN
jgi:spore germination protein YaaH